MLKEFGPKNSLQKAAELYAAKTFLVQVSSSHENKSGNHVLCVFWIASHTAPQKIYYLFYRYFLWWPEWFFSVCQKNFIWCEECTVVLDKKTVGQLSLDIYGRVHLALGVETWRHCFKRVLDSLSAAGSETVH